jgi:hypothetical protein
MNILTRPMRARSERRNVLMVDEFDVTTVDDWSASTPLQRQWLTDNRETLDKWLEGTDKDDALFVGSDESDLASDFGVLGVKTIANLAKLEALRLESEGNIEGAWKLYRAMFRCSRHVGRHAGTIPRVTGAAIHAVAADAINRWASNELVTGEMLKDALADIREDMRLAPPPSDAIKVEYIFCQKLLDSIGIEKSRTIPSFYLYFIGEPEFSRRAIQHYFAGQLALHLDSDNEGSVPNHLTSDQLEKYIQRSHIASTLLAGGPLMDSLAREKACAGALEMALTAQIHFRQKGAMPEHPDALLEDGLHIRPPDPFAPSKTPIQYKIDSSTGNAIAWSVGDDRVDDGGNVEFTVEGEQSKVQKRLESPLPRFADFARILDPF